VEFDANTQQRLDAKLFAEYRLSDIVGINSSLHFDQSTGDRVRAQDGSEVEDLDFTRWQAYLGARVFW
jgi:hypothetical protein